MTRATAASQAAPAAADRGRQQPGPAAGYLEKLGARTRRVGSVLCLGLDPDADALPAGFSRDVHGIERFAAVVLDAALPFVAAVKPNLAFYEAFGSAGLAALERLRARIPADVPVVLDAKRGDIGSTAAKHAVALLDTLGGDAVTLSPYLGGDALAPFLERANSFAYVLCRTSNPGGGELQSLLVEAAPSGDEPREPLWARVARRALSWNARGNVGLVVGATTPTELAAARVIAPGLPFLVPGLGAQGGDAAAVLSAGFATARPASERPGKGLLVNVSRAIASAPADGATAAARDPGTAVAEAARDWAARLPVLT
jgi:orotidine-5'-phosphate decarboxylase